MNKRLQGIIIGILISVFCSGGIIFAASSAGVTLNNVRVGGVKIVVDGKEIRPTNANGDTVEPMIYQGTTYLPVRAIANAFDKSVYWDGSTFTVYLGEMEGKLQEPTTKMIDLNNIASTSAYSRLKTSFTDNLGTTYKLVEFFPKNDEIQYEVILNKKYSQFKGSICVQNNSKNDGSRIVTVKADGKVIYTSPEITKTSAPIDFDINVSGCYLLEISCVKSSGEGTSCPPIAFCEAGFYQ